MGKFEYFLINEESNHLGHKLNDILTAMQDMQEDMPNLGTRHLNRLAEEIVGQIRKILHSHWTSQQQKYLYDLQKIAVALQKTVDEKGDIKEVLPAAVQLLQNVAGKLGVRVNSLEAPEEIQGTPISQNDFEITGTGPNKKSPEENPGMDQMPG